MDQKFMRAFIIWNAHVEPRVGESAEANEFQSLLLGTEMKMLASSKSNVVHESF